MLVDVDGRPIKIRGRIRREVFWPPAKPAPKYSEIYSAICNDRQMQLGDDEADDGE